jgi:putative transposase
VPRKARIDAPGALHHIIIRGIEGRDIFRDNPDRQDFLDRLDDLLFGTGTRCFAWALLPNHAHLLLQTGAIPIAGIMRRLLTGYAVVFNLKYRRHGHLFQNRYKSILCQEERYLRELVRYIHLNPFRAGLLPDLAGLDQYPWSGHSVLLGRVQREWQATEYILGLFDARKSQARKAYRAFIEQGIAQGRRPDLVGGGLIRSANGWDRVLEMRKQKGYIKGDERILGDSDFVQRVLKEAEERLHRRYAVQMKGLDFDKTVLRVAEITKMEPFEVLRRTKTPQAVKARSLLFYWANHDLGMSVSEISKRTGICQSAVSRGAARGARIAGENQYRLMN